MPFNLTYIFFILPGLILSIIASIAVNSAYKKWSRVSNTRNMTAPGCGLSLKPLSTR